MKLQLMQLLVGVATEGPQLIKDVDAVIKEVETDEPNMDKVKRVLVDVRKVLADLGDAIK